MFRIWSHPQAISCVYKHFKIWKYLKHFLPRHFRRVLDLLHFTSWKRNFHQQTKPSLWFMSLKMHGAFLHWSFICEMRTDNTVHIYTKGSKECSSVFSEITCQFKRSRDCLVTVISARCSVDVWINEGVDWADWD